MPSEPHAACRAKYTAAVQCRTYPPLAYTTSSRYGVDAATNGTLGATGAPTTDLVPPRFERASHCVAHEHVEQFKCLVAGDVHASMRDVSSIDRRCASRKLQYPINDRGEFTTSLG
jgi:hypothetical protein